MASRFLFNPGLNHISANGGRGGHGANVACGGDGGKGRIRIDYVELLGELPSYAVTNPFEKTFTVKYKSFFLYLICAVSVCFLELYSSVSKIFFYKFKFYVQPENSFLLRRSEVNKKFRHVINLL